MAKQLNVSLAFTADTSQAKMQLKDLQQSLSQLMKIQSETGKLGLTEELLKAKSAVGDLQIALQSATTSTGTLDLSKFNSALQSSGLKVDTLRQQLEKLGPEGSNAFLKLSQSVISAEAPLKRTSALLDNFAVSLKNTVRWQISSSVLHSFMGTVQSAYGYAQDLNESLNSIRIVTGQSAEEMARFAEQANKAAQRLSTTTTAYTDAALIFYQQGLDDKAVKDRTETVLKMSNVTGEAASEVSSYMTAIWNNFDNGSESLEHYADVITALGASTASSSAEIAAGLEKFASIGKTIGLSYDYATSALATIVSATRQSADSVGTGLRTIFSRLQGLSLGETLEDGTDLNKYSKALKTVGVDILDATGNMREMDTILNDLADKWDNLSQAQQTALAQTVGGVRQYTTLITLMNNWDSMEKNLSTAQSSTGSLQKQADIYAESWEAAKKRVKAAAQDIYDSLLNDKFFISLNNGLAKVLSGLNSVISAMGGLRGVIPGVLSLMMKLYGDSMAKSIDNIIFNIQRNTKAFQNEQQVLREQFYDNAMKINADSGTSAGEAQQNVLKRQLELQGALKTVASEVSEEELKRLQLGMDIVKQYDEQVVKMAELKDKATENLQENRSGLIREAARNNHSTGLFGGKEVSSSAALKQLQTMETAALKAQKDFEKLNKEFLKTGDLDKYRTGLQKVQQGLHKAGFDKSSAAMQRLREASKQAGDGIRLFGEKLDILQSEGGLATDTLIDIDKVADELSDEFGWNTEELEKFRNSVRNFVASGDSMETAIKNAANATEEWKQKCEATKNAIAKLGTTGQTFIQVSQGLNQLLMGASSLISIFETAMNPDLTGWEKFKSILISAPMGISMLINGLKGLNEVRKTLVLAANAETAAESKNLFIKAAGTIAAVQKTAATGAEAVAEESLTGNLFLQAAAWLAVELSMSPVLALTLVLTAAIVALAAIIFVVVNAVQAISAKHNEDAIAAENAANAARNLAEAYEEVKEEYNSMISAMENYQSARESLDSLTQGTQEYREALNQANEAALELIKLGNLIKGEDYTIENGEIIINDSSMQKAKEAKFNEMQDAYASSTMAQAKAAQAKTKSDQTDLVRKNDSKAIGVATATGAALGTIVPGIGNIVGAIGGAIIGAIGGAVYNSIDNAKEQSRIDELTALYGQIGEAAFDAATLQELGFDTSNQAYINSIQDVVRATDQAAAQMEVAAQIAAQAVLEQDKEFQASNYQDKISAAAGKGYQSEYEKAYETYLAKTKNNDWFGVGSQDNKDAMAEYAKQMGLDQLNGYKVTNFKKGGNVEYTYIDENGEKQTKEVTQQQIAAQLAATEATKQLEAQTETLLNTFNRLEKSGDAADKALSDFASGDISNSTMSEFEGMENELSQYITTDENGNRKIADDTDITQYIKDNFSEEEITALGYASAEEMATAFKTQFNASLASWDSIEIPDAFADMGIDMSLKTAQALENTFKEINLGPAGADTAKKFSDTFTEALSGLNASDQQEALAQLMTIDWSDWDAMDQAVEIMNSFGKSIDTSSEEWKQLTAQMRLATGAVPDFSQLKENLNAISGILQDLDFGSTISDEDYQRLVAYNDEWERFFILQADGSRMFIGDSEAMLQQTRDNIREQQKELETRKAAQQGFKDANWGHQGENGWVSADWKNKSGSDTTTATNLLNASGATQTALEALGYTDEVIQDMITKATSGQEDLVAEGEAELREMYQRIAEFQTEDLNLMDAQFKEMLASTATNISDLQQMLQGGDIDASAYDKQLTVLAQNASSLEELQQIRASGLNGEAGLDTLEYGDALVKMAENYDNCTDAIKNYNEALLSGDAAQIQAAQSALELEIEIGELSNKYGLDAKEVSSYAKRLAKNFEETGMSQEQAAEAAKRAAVNNTRLDRGLTNLNKNIDSYKKFLKAANKGTAEWSRTMDELKDDLADILGVDASTLTDTFGEAALNSEDLKLALDGNVDAIKRLQEAAAQEMILDIKANLPENEVSNFMTQWDYLRDNMSRVIEAPGVDQTDLINSFNAMIKAGNMTKEQIETALAGLHVSANVKTTYVSQKQQVPLTITETSWLPSGTMTVPIPDGNGGTRNETYTSMRRVTKTYDAGVDEADVVVPQYEIEGTKGSGNSTVAFTAAPPPRASKSATTSGGAGGGGGGGGGGSSSPPKYNEEKHKNTNDEKERYHVIKNQLEDLSSQYENISKAKDKAFGAARLANLNKEISAQKKLTQANREYLSEIEKYLSDDRAAVKALGANIDENGTILNYDALIQKAVDDYNTAVDAFNRATTDDEGAQKAFEAAQERYDQFMETISQYEETQDLYKEQMQQVLDDIMTEQSLLLERTQLEVELKINVSEDALEYLEYMMDNIENKAYDCAEAFGYLNGMTQEYFKTAEALEGGLRSLFANQGLTDADFQKLIEGDTATYNKLMDMLSSGGTADLSDGLQQSEIDAAYGFTADDVDTMRDYVSQLIEANQNLQEIRQTVHEQILNVWDEWNEKLDAGIAKIEHLQLITESYQNIIDIVGQKNLGVSNAFMSKMRQQSIDQANDKLEAEKARYESLKKARDDAYAKFEEQKSKGILSPEEIKQWEDSLAQMDEDVQSASEDFQSAWEDALTAANEAFEAAVDQIMQAYDDAAAGLMGSMSDLQDAFDRKSDLSSQYLADYEKIYQLTKLNRDLENSIDSTNNTKAKAELLELQSKINAYEEAGIDISEYQMEQLRQEYELKKAQIELEESQEAKSQVQMTRDADGNYSYVYTANADDVANAEQNYEDKLHQMQESNANYINDLQSNMIQMEQDYQDKVQEIMKDTSLTAEERMIKLNELNQYYDEKMKFYMSETELWEENSQRLYEEDWMNYAAATGYKISSEEEWLDHWNETQLSILTGFGSLEEYQTNHNMNVANLLLSSSDAFATWQTNIETAMQNAGTSMGTFQEDATEVLNTVAEESEETKDSVVDMAETAADKIGEVVEAVVDWENQYSATVQKMLTWNNALITSFNRLIAGWSAVQSSANSSGAGSGDGSSSSSGSGSGSSSSSANNGSNSGNSGGSVDNSDKVAGVAAAIWMDGASASGWGNNPTRATRLKEKGVEGAQAYINAHGANGDIYADWANKRNQLRNYYYGSFDTGGYTGEWGLDGKFAMLHEKELVLNKDDTTHFLQAIDIVRQISELIDLNALSSAGGLSSLLAATASSSSQKLEQQVTIHAEFPNVTDKDQITEAFTDLVNLASQYANRK